MRKRLFRAFYWVGIVALAILVALMLFTVIGGFFHAYQKLPDGLVNFWDGLFGIFATIIAIVLTASINSYIKNRENRNQKNEDSLLEQQKLYCKALQDLMNLVYRAESINNMVLEHKQQEREAWVLEWRELWNDIHPIIANLHQIQDDKCREYLDRAFGAIYKYVIDSIGGLDDVQSAFDLAVKNCKGCREVVIDREK
jgi:hypothetical protein